MYSQANVREESVLRPPTRALPSVIVDTENVLREADGPEESAPSRGQHRLVGGKVFASKPDGESWEEPEEHKRDEKTVCIQARSSVARALEFNGKARQIEGEVKVV